MEHTSFAQWCAWQKEQYNHLPFLIAFDLSTEPTLTERRALLSWEPIWHDASEDCAFVLESGKSGQFTYIGLKPVATIRGSHEQSLVQLKQWMSAFRAPRLPFFHGFAGGCVGYLSYDIARSLEHLPTLAQADLDLPDYYFARYDQIWIIDHHSTQLYCVAFVHVSNDCTQDQLRSLYDQVHDQVMGMKLQWDEWQKRAVTAGTWRHKLLAEPFHAKGLEANQTDEIQTSFSKQTFIQAVERIQDYIRAGDVFQVNLSVRQSKPLHSQPSDIYEWLRMINPSPYMGFLKFPEFDIVCGSPELLIKLDQASISTRPIAGTRPRGSNNALDEQLEVELILNEKERAEHIMLVDLERNDIGRVAKWGSVKVNELMTIEKYSHVMHIVSQVEGELRSGLDAYDVIAATFPGGTITGAPKIRTMEIIEELEPVRRGIYTGSLGWIDYRGDMELNIIIRTLLAHQGWAHVQAGAGIVIDSEPVKEFTESLNKAKALWTAVRYSEWAQTGVN